MPAITRSSRRLTIQRVPGSTASWRVGIAASVANPSASAIKLVSRSDIEPLSSGVAVSAAAAGTSGGSASSTGDGRVAVAPATAAAAGTDFAGRFLFGFGLGFGFARTTGFAFVAGSVGRCTLGREGARATTFDRGREGVLDTEGAAGRGLTALGFGFGCGADRGGSGAGSGAGEGGEGSVTTGSVGTGSWARAAGAHSPRAATSAAQAALPRQTGVRPLSTRFRMTPVGGVI
jgi:hypothetical protein